MSLVENLRENEEDRFDKVLDSFSHVCVHGSDQDIDRAVKELSDSDLDDSLYFYFSVCKNLVEEKSNRRHKEKYNELYGEI